MVWLRGGIFIIIVLLILSFVGLAGGYIQNHKMESRTVETSEPQKNWWEVYNDLEKINGLVADKAIEAVEYSGWINDSEEEVINTLSNIYGEPLRSEIIESVLEFRKESTDWHYTYEVENVYLYEENEYDIKVIVEINEKLAESIVAKGLALFTFDKNIKIIEHEYLW